MFRRRIALARCGLAALVLVGLPLAAQQRPAARPFLIEQWSIDDGLPVNSVNALHQGRDGYLWAATYDGLARFDGARFTVFNAANSPGLPSDRLLRITETRDGALWLLTEARRLVHVARGRFTPMDSSRGVLGAAMVLYEEPTGHLWLGTSKGLFERRGDRFVPVFAGDILGSVTSVVRRRDGSLWVGTTRAGIHRIADGRAERVSQGTALDSSEVLTFFEDPLERLWLSVEWATTGGVRMIPKGGRIGNAPVWPRPFVLQLAWVPEWRATVGYSTEGLARLDGTTAGFLVNRAHSYTFTVIGRPEGVGAANASSVVQDSARVLWVGSLDRGASRVAASRDSGSTFGTIARTRQALPLLVDGRDRLLVGTGWTLEECAIPRMQCRSAELPDPPPVSLLALYRTRDDRVLAGGWGQVFERVNGRWRRLPGWTSTERARAFAETADGTLWIGTGGDGVVRCRDSRCRAIRRKDGLPSDLIRSSYVDVNGWLWIGSEGRGLARLDPRGWSADDAAHRPPIVHYSVEDGLHDPVVHHIIEDDDGRFWINSNRGIYWIQRSELLAFAEGRLRRINSTAYAERDGLRNREGNGGFQPAGLRDAEGTLWFPTQAGIVGVDPRRVPIGRTAPAAVVEQVSVRGRAEPVDTAMIRLAADERDLEIAYTAIAFREPGNVRLRCRLAPYDDDWVDAGKRRTAFYTRVPAGRYTFRVQASRGGDQWSEQPAMATLEIAPFFSETGLARGLLVAALLLAVAGGVQWRVRALRRREEELTALVAEATAALRRNEAELAAQNATLAQLNQLRSRLFADLSHEFRTPLTLILGPLRSMLDGRQGPLPPAVRGQSELMLRNAQRLLRLINQVLDLSRLQAGAVAITRQPFDLVAFVRMLAQAFLPLAERQGIAVVVRSPLPSLTVSADAEELEKVLLNLLSNAVKFTGAGGMVDVGVTAEGNQAVITVRDTGIGIAAEDLPRVFERFYRAESDATRRFDGSGIGLALAKELVELHDGTIEVASASGVGSTFTVRLPIGATSSEDAAMATRDGRALAELLGGETPAGGYRVPLRAGHDAADADAGEDAEQDDDRPLVLLVDDNADIRRYVRGILANDFRVAEAADGRAGLAMARELLPDVIVADVMMPELDGLGLGRALKDDAMTDAIPLILLTARAAADDQIAGLKVGADAYLVKPFDPGVLAAAVGNLLGQRQRLRERLRSGETPPPATGASEEEEVPALDRQLRPIVVGRMQDSGFNPEALAAAAGLSYHQLYRNLRDVLDTTPSGYIRRVRAECAAALLREGAGSVSEIAYAVGFESLSYFRRAFKERYGCAPSEFVGGNPGDSWPAK